MGRALLFGMISDLDIYRAAKMLIDQHGTDAALNAAGRADLLLMKVTPTVPRSGRRSSARSRSCSGTADLTRR